MTEQALSIKFPPFEVVVTERADHKVGMHSRKTEQHVYYFALKDKPDEEISIQPLNQNFIPSGRKKYVVDEDFARKYKPEPLIYLNKVKPLLEGINSSLEKGDELREKGKLQAAENKYKEVLDIDEDNVRATFGLGITYLSCGDTQNASILFEKLSGLDQTYAAENKHLFNEFGIKLRKNGMYNEGLKYYRQAVEMTKDDENLHYNIARILFEMENYEEAMESARAALVINSEFAEAQKLLKVCEKRISKGGASKDSDSWGQ